MKLSFLICQRERNGNITFDLLFCAIAAIKIFTERPTYLPTHAPIYANYSKNFYANYTKNTL